MPAYADTSFLARVYTPHADSTKALTWMQRAAGALPFTPLHRHELRNAVRLRVFRGEITAEQRKQALGLTLQTIDKTAAGKKLADRLEYLAEMYGFACNRVTIRQQKTRWGSCSPKNNISLNIKLVLLPEELLDYVILHELVHTRIHNHSRKFWVELDKYVMNSKGLAKRLKMNEIVLL